MESFQREERFRDFFTSEEESEDRTDKVFQMLLKDPLMIRIMSACGQNSLHKAVDINAVEIAELLLEKGVNPNMRNSEGLTALHVAVMKKQRRMVEKIFKRSKFALDLDSYRDNNGETTRDVLKKNWPNLWLPPHIDTLSDVDKLKYHPIANEETGYLDCLRAIPNNPPIDVENLLEIAVQRKFKNAVSELLKRRTASCNLEKAANIAIRNDSPDILGLILNDFDDMDPKVVGELLLRIINRFVLLPRSHRERLECLRVILEMKDVDVHYTNKDGCSALHYAAKANNHEAAMMLLQKGHYIGHTNDVGEPVVSFLSPSTLSQFFDDCIQPCESPFIFMNEKYTSFDHRCLFPPSTSQQQESNQQMDIFQHIAGNARLKHLLKHPLLSSFIYQQWRRIRPLRNVNFVLYFLRYVLLCGYMIYITFKKPSLKLSTDSPHKGSTNTSAITESTPNPSKDPLKVPSNDIILLQIFISPFLIVFLFWKLFQLIAHTYYYWPKDCTWRSFILNKCISCFRNEPQYRNLCQYVTNWAELVLEVVLEVVGFCVLWGALPRWLYAMLILPHSWLLMVSWGNCAMLFTDIALYKTVSSKFLRFLFVYGILIFSFVSAFFILLNAETFKNFQLSTFQTIIMLTGDLNADSELFDTFPVLSRLVFVVFVFMIVIVFFNLLVGLAVSDTAEIIGQAELVGLSSMVNLISHIDNIATNISNDRLPNYWPFNLIVTLARRFDTEHFRDPTLIIKYDDPIMKSIGIEKVREILSKRGQQSDTEKMIEKVALLFDDKVSLLDGKMSLLDAKMSSLDDKLSSLDAKLNTLTDFLDSRSKPGTSGA